MHKRCQTRPGRRFAARELTLPGWVPLPGKAETHTCTDSQQSVQSWWARQVTHWRLTIVRIDSRLSIRSCQCRECCRTAAGIRSASHRPSSPCNMAVPLRGAILGSELGRCKLQVKLCPTGCCWVHISRTSVRLGQSAQIGARHVPCSHPPRAPPAHLLQHHSAEPTGVDGKGEKAQHLQLLLSVAGGTRPERLQHPPHLCLQCRTSCGCPLGQGCRRGRGLTCLCVHE